MLCARKCVYRTFGAHPNRQLAKVEGESVNRSRAIIPAVVLAVVAAACGGDDDQSTDVADPPAGSDAPVGTEADNPGATSVPATEETQPASTAAPTPSGCAATQ